MKDFKIKIKAGTLEGMTEDREIVTKVFVLSEDFGDKTNYLFIGNRDTFPAFPLGEPWGEGFGESITHSYDHAHFEYFDYRRWTKKRWNRKFEGKYRENILAYVRGGKIITGNEELLEKAGVSIVE